VAAALVRLNAHVLGGVLALIAGAGLFAATLVLLAQGGPATGQMLVLLAHFFPGYAISFGGAVIGGLWAALTKRKNGRTSKRPAISINAMVINA